MSSFYPSMPLANSDGTRVKKKLYPSDISGIRTFAMRKKVEFSLVLIRTSPFHEHCVLYGELSIGCFV